jgi:hypothetical protein
MTLNEHMNRFRVASRELFNGYFRSTTAYDDPEAWVLHERFGILQKVLFHQLVTEPASLEVVSYGDPQPQILIEVQSDPTPWMLNRHVNSGYWNGQPEKVSQEARLPFISFFDWDQLGVRDNRYVRVQVANWAAQPDVVGKHALIESHHVRYVESPQSA